MSTSITCAMVREAMLTTIDIAMVLADRIFFRSSLSTSDSSLIMYIRFKQFPWHKNQFNKSFIHPVAVISFNKGTYSLYPVNPLCTSRLNLYNDIYIYCPIFVRFFQQESPGSLLLHAKNRSVLSCLELILQIIECQKFKTQKQFELS